MPLLTRIGLILLAVLPLCGWAQFGGVQQPMYGGNVYQSYLYMRYDADALGLSDGDLVSTFTDQGIYHFDALSSGSSRPYWTNSVSEINNEGYLYFDGSDDWMGTNVAVLKDPPYQIFLVAALPSAAGGDKVIIEDSTTTNYSIFMNGGAQIFGSVQYLTKTNASLTNWMIFEYCVNGTNSFMRTNNVLWKYGTLGDRPMYGINFSKAANPCQMKVAYCSVETNVLSEASANQIATALGTRFGITIGTRDALPNTWNPCINDKLLSYYDPARTKMTTNLLTPVGSLKDWGPYSYHLLVGGSTPANLRSYPHEHEGDPRAVINDGTQNTFMQTNFTTYFPQPTLIIEVAEGVVYSSGVLFFCDTGSSAGTTNFQSVYCDDVSWLKLNAGTQGAVAMPNMNTFAIYEFLFDGSGWGVRSNNVAIATDGTASIGTKGRMGHTFGAECDQLYPTTHTLWLAAIYTNTITATERSNIYYYLGSRFNLPVTLP